MKVIFPGSFDPITNGHIDIIKRASFIFDEVIVLLMENPSKQYTFSKEERILMMELSLKNMKNVKVDWGTGLTVNYAKEHGVSILIRGIREVMDYKYEIQQATINMLMDGNVETFFMLAKPEYSFLSSSATKIVAQNNGEIKSFVPREIIDIIYKKYR